jgi:hypothetical protein
MRISITTFGASLLAIGFWARAGSVTNCSSTDFCTPASPAAAAVSAPPRFVVQSSYSTNDLGLPPIESAARQEIDLVSTPAPPVVAPAGVAHDPATETPVEPIPAPSAVASGMLVLAGLAGFRLLRRLRLA